MNHLNFNQMVNKALLGHQENKFFNVTHINPENYYEPERQAAKVKQAKERLNLDGKINNIIFNVHEQLRERQSSPKSSKTKPKAIKSKSKVKSSPSKQFISNNNCIKPLDINECQYVSLPRMKILCSDKHKERVNKSTETTSNYISYENHKRMMSAQHRQYELENMIKEHKLLIEDRRSLEQDIFAMRHSLDDLQHRVNSSLRELSNKKTYCEFHGLKSANTCKKCDDNKKSI